MGGEVARRMGRSRFFGTSLPAVSSLELAAPHTIALRWPRKRDIIPLATQARD